MKTLTARKPTANEKALCFAYEVITAGFVEGLPAIYALDAETEILSVTWPSSKDAKFNDKAMFYVEAGEGAWSRMQCLPEFNTEKDLIGMGFSYEKPEISEGEDW